MSVTLLLARQLSQSAPGLAASFWPAASCAGAAVPKPSAAASTAAASHARPPLSVRMVGHSVGHRLYGIEPRVYRHEQEEREVDCGEDAGQHDVQPLRRLQPEEAEHHEGQRE